MNQYEKIAKDLEEILDVEDIKINEPMKEHISFKVGGAADILVTPKTFNEVKSLIEFCNDNKIKYYFMGNGSNLIIKDGGIRGIVIKLTKLDKITVQGERIIAQSGVTLLDTSNVALENSLTGIEFASGIPGSIGGAVTMNAGAYDGEMSNVIESVLVIDREANLKTLFKEELELSYRMSAIQKYEYVVLEVTLKLEQGDKDRIKYRVDELTDKRNEKQPLEYASAGSTFKRPEGYFTGKLIQDCGLKGYNIGDAQVSEKHSGFVINKGEATANDVLNLIKHVQKSVYEKFNVELHTEVRILGEDEVSSKE